MTDDPIDHIYKRLDVMKQRSDLMWGDFYGDDRRKERGILGDTKDIALAVNRLSIVLVFFAIISLLNLAAFVWLVLSL